MMLLASLVLSLCWQLSTTQDTTYYNNTADERCSCRCPEVSWVDSSITVDFPTRKLYINSTLRAADCDCEHVVQPVLGLNKEQVEKFCPRCVCKHEERSTVTIKVSIIFILWVVGMLVLYLIFLVCVEPFFNKVPRVQVRRGTNLPAYQQHTDQPAALDNDSSLSLRDYNLQPGGSQPQEGLGPRGVVNRLGREQDKWKRQLEVQRSTVYDRHSMLN